MAHNCKAQWDPTNVAVSLKNTLVGLTAQHGKGWARHLDDEAVFLSLLTLKGEMEHARGVMGTLETGWALGTLSDSTLKPKADAILGGLAEHVDDPEHTDNNNPVGQFGWITKVDYTPPLVEFVPLMQALRDCLDLPPGQGGKKSPKIQKTPKKLEEPPIRRRRGGRRR